MALRIIKSEEVVSVLGEIEILYHVTYGARGGVQELHYPNEIKHTLRSLIGLDGTEKIKLEKRYRRKLEEGKSFQIRVAAGQRKLLRG